MTAIVIHAGMPKAGSSSVQRWLQKSSTALRDSGVTLAFAPPCETEEVEFVPYERGPINSSWLVDRAVGRDAATQERLVEALIGALASAADRHGDLVVSGESFALPFWALHEPTLRGFERLAGSYEVRVAYYARPQHTSLEAAWRQFGYRTGEKPAGYVEERAGRLRYAATRRGVHSLAPGVDFEPRAFRSDLLEGGDVVHDFARCFLGVEVAGEAEWANRGLPLAVVNTLAAAPAGMFWERSYGNQRIDRIKRLLDGVEFPDDDRIALSRLVLRKYAFELFTEENAELGWEDFVPPLEDGGVGVPGIDSLDELWAPRASAAELALVFTALERAIRNGTP